MRILTKALLILLMIIYLAPTTSLQISVGVPVAIIIAAITIDKLVRNFVDRKR